MAQEVQSQSLVFVRAFDQAGHVGEDDLLVVDGEDAEIGRQGRERIAGDLRVGVGDGLEQAALACVGKANQGDVGDHLQLECDVPFLARFAFFRKARGAPLRTGEMGVALAAAPSPGDDAAVARFDEVGQRRVGAGVVNDRAAGDVDRQVLAVGAVAQGAAAGQAAFGGETASVLIIGKRQQILSGLDDDAAAVAAVAAVGSAFGNELFASETDAAVAAMAGFDVDPHEIDKFQGKHLFYSINATGSVIKNGPLSMQGSTRKSECRRAAKGFTRLQRLFEYPL